MTQPMTPLGAGILTLVLFVGVIWAILSWWNGRGK